MAKAFGAMFSALYIKTPSAASLESKDKERLLSNIHFAEECGASVTTVCGDDIPFQIAEYARLSGVTKIVIGRSVVNKKRLALQPTLTEKLISLAPNVDIHIIPDSDAVLPKGKAKVFEKPAFFKILKGVIVSTIVLSIATLLGYIFSKFGFTDANIITVYMLGILITAILTESKICWVLSSVVSVLLFNFCLQNQGFRC
ncbi:MAG: DUF4118 domain-containing protein [Christensenella sp.]|nr:MAG: DUF4118 domain-containing protein [Christensenella sp.]